MEHAQVVIVANSDVAHQAAQIVDRYLKTLMIPDPVGARAFIAPDLEIIFTGGRLMHDPAECAAFNASRYAWVKKNYERIEVMSGATQEQAIVYSLGTLFGAWPDQIPFKDNRYIDRYVVKNGLITHMSVWNDSAEIILTRSL